MPRGTQVPAALLSGSGTRLSLALAGLSRPLPLPTPRSRMPALQPRMNVSTRFGLFPVRSPLLRESRLISFPSGTEMFHFPEFAPCNLSIQLQATGYDSRRVAPFRDPRLTGCLAPPRGLSQLTTSFIAFRRQGIHPMLLSTCFSKRISFLPYSIVKEPLPAKLPDLVRGKTGTPVPISFRHGRSLWWSWTESNRRPPACKAGALPTELQPRTALWWAWKDLNFRPHAYQACALTT